MNREEIRKEIKRIIQNGVSQDFAGVDVGSTPEDIIEFLHSQDVVIKVDRKLPSGGEARLTLPSSKHLSYWRGWKQAQIDMTRASYVAVEPLIEDD